MTKTLTSRLVGRLAGSLLIGSGLLTAASLLLPQPPGIDRRALLLLCGMAIGVGAVAWLLPWHRWRRSTSLLLLPVGFALIAAGNYFGSTEPYTFGLFFVVAFAWLGIGHPRWSSLYWAVPATIAYITPIILRSDEFGAAALSSAALTIPVCILVAESLAWTADRERRSHGRAESLARAATALGMHLDEGEIFRSLVTEAQRALEAEHALLYRLDPDEPRIDAVYTAGVGKRFEAVVQGLVGTRYANLPVLDRLAETDQPIVVEDVREGHPFPAELVDPFNIQSFVVMPVTAAGRLVGVLTCVETTRKRRYGEDELRLARGLAGQAGAAIHNALLYRQTQQAARMDILTGLGNRRAFHERMASELERSKRHGRPLSLVLLDPDGFKRVNDLAGHQAGDRVLVRLAGILSASLRAGDGAYRIGGDEFALILPETPAGTAAGVAERIRGSVERARVAAEQNVTLTASVGIAAYPEHGATDDELTARADAALYEVKDAGGNGVALARPAERRGAGVRFGVDVLEVIDRRLIRASYQPIVRLEDGSLLGYETFCRLDDDRGGTPITTLLRAAASIGRLEALDCLCRDTALNAAGDLPPGALLFLNVSTGALESARFDPKPLLDLLEPMDVGPERLVIEVGEPQGSTDSGPLVTSLRRCRQAGFRVALDDLTATGDLGVLGRLPFDFVKVDLAALTATEPDRRAAVLEGLRGLIVRTGAEALAEGVETREDLALVREAGYAAAQGFLLGEPRDTFGPPEVGNLLSAS